MSKFKIEKVFHGLTNSFDTCCLIDYFIVSDFIYQFNYTNEEFALKEAKTNNTIGIWRIKSLKNKNN